jgi:hypothetical protein
LNSCEIVGLYIVKELAVSIWSDEIKELAASIWSDEII